MYRRSFMPNGRSQLRLCKRLRHFGESLRHRRRVCSDFAPKVGCFREFRWRRRRLVCRTGSHMSMTILIDVMQNQQSRSWRNPRLLQSTRLHTSHSNTTTRPTLPVCPQHNGVVCQLALLQITIILLSTHTMTIGIKMHGTSYGESQGLQ